MSARDLLVISDLHLGEDLGRKTPRTAALERQLIEFLDFHRCEGPRWRLVINGDMIELVGVTVMPSDVEHVADLHWHDHHYGLGAREAAAVHKMRAIVTHHQGVFDALARFIGDGHQLSVVIGNHDAELHWARVQEVFSAAIGASLVAQRPWQADAAEGLRAAIWFHPWFFHEEGVAWIEHGHQYDPYCSFDDVLEPATDAREIDPHIGGLLVRYLVNRFEGDLHDAWGEGFFGYLRIWLRQGPQRIRAVGLAYLHVLGRLVEHWRSRIPERLEARRKRAQLRRQRLARTRRIDEAKLAELAKLWHPPIASDLGRGFRALMVDRLTLLLTAPFAVLALLLAPSPVRPVMLAVGLPVLVLWAWVAWQAREPVSPVRSMKAKAKRIRELVKLPFVVMGHSHEPCNEPAGGYLNTGTWVPHSDPDKAFTHVRIQRTKGGVRALLCQWRDGASKVFDPEGGSR
ncbi:MAG: hypothetical protein KTR31_10780 [Myxococcales bacterium]|nr:hypothetical protein [Myxococcales bacterium]